jgi:multisubunit Na+/H+ antiporter MnhG subunit
MSSGGGKKVSRDLDLCNLFIKFFLFTINLIVWLLGVAFLALGIYAVVLSFDGTVEIIGANVVSTPGIILIVLGVILIVVGFCGWLGALREIFVLLVIVSLLD